MIAGLVTAALGVFARVSRRGFPGIQFGTLVLGVWVPISSFVLNMKYSMATPMFWSNSWSGSVLVLAGLATLCGAGR